MKRKKQFNAKIFLVVLVFSAFQNQINAVIENAENAKKPVKSTTSSSHSHTGNRSVAPAAPVTDEGNSVGERHNGANLSTSSTGEQILK